MADDVVCDSERPLEFVERAGAELPADWDRERFRAMAPHIQERLERLSDAPATVDFLFVADGDELEWDDASWEKATKQEWAQPLLADVISAYESLPAESWNAETLKATIEDVMARYEIKLGKAQAPVRVAVTGRSVGPPLFESLEVLGQSESVRRMRAAMTRFGDAGPSD